jgi:arsenite-transporting ATPase
MEVDAKGLFNQAIEGVSGKASSIHEMMRLVSQTPGIDEFGAIEVLMEAMEKAAHDVVILDTAPTGHTLRLLMLPDLLDSWIGKMVEMKARIARMGRMLRRLIPGEEPPNADQLEQNLEGGRRRIGTLRQVLSDPNRAQLFLVTIPEAMSVLETDRTLKMLSSNSLPVAAVIVNQLQPHSETCLHCIKRRKIHLAELDHMQECAGSVPIRVVESLSWEIRGIEGLKRLGNMLWAK